MFTIKAIIGNDIKILKTVKGANLLLTLAENGIFIPASCGGKGNCGKCKVQLIQGKINCEVDANGFFNSCKCVVNSDITIKINTVDGSGITQTGETTIDAVSQNGYGLAIDIGTTTVAYYLIDLKNSTEIDAQSDLNRQAVYGADVISRINAAGNGQLHNLHKTIVNQINEMIEKFCKKHNIDKIEKIAIAGNTTMLHLVLGIDPSPLGVYPFTPVFLSTKYTNKNETGIACDNIILLPSVSAYIGSDTVSGILSSEMLEKGETSLLIDIGTNGEMVLNCNQKLFACATAAGPAFEGANIEKGMAGIKNAIDHIYYKENKLVYTTVDGEAKGICGSGLIDIIAVLVNNGIIDETGLLTSDGNHYLAERVRENKFYITDDVYITQKDIREFQLAKSAIKSGIITLLKAENIKPENVDCVYLAGGFGHYLDKNNAVITGLLPQEFAGKIQCIGNASGLGAKMCLLNGKYIEKCENISKVVEIIELSNSSVFMENFIDNMSFDVEG